MVRRLVRSNEEPEPDPPAPVEDTPLLYNAEDAGRLLGGISKAMVYRYVQRGQLHPTRLGSRTLFSREELERFVKAQEEK